MVPSQQSVHGSIYIVTYVALHVCNVDYLDISTSVNFPGLSICALVFGHAFTTLRT